MTRSFSTIWVIGLGSIGSAWVTRLARGGHHVVGIEPDPAALAGARAEITKALADFPSPAGEPGPVDYRSGAVQAAPADLVIEAVPEQLRIKVDVLREAGGYCSPDTVFATTTTGFPVTEIASAAGRMTRTIGLHVAGDDSLVELVCTPVTDQWVRVAAAGLLDGLGATTVPVSDQPGFIGGSLLLRYLNDAAAMYEQGYATREDIDTAMTLGCGLPHGPLAHLDLIGLDVVTDSLTALAERTGDRGYAPTPVLSRMVSAGLLGRKSGRGFYTYNGPERLTEDDGVTTRPPAGTLPISRLGIMGSGTMAAGIAEVSAQAGYPTILLARTDVSAKEALSRVEQSLDRRVRRGKLGPQQMSDTLANLTVTSDQGLFSEPDLVIEAVTEDLDVKRSVFATLDRITRPDAVLATSTSCLPVIACATATGRPDRVVGMHFFNPAPAMKLVEVVRTFLTTDQVVATATALASSLGKRAVHCPDRTGFIVNSLLFPYLNHAVGMLRDRSLSPDVIDQVMTGAHGYPLGPFQLLDLIGLDVSLAIQERLYETFGLPTLAPAPPLAELAAAGYTGVKSGRGFRAH